jgi:hypothetical protein
VINPRDHDIATDHRVAVDLTGYTEAHVFAFL